MEYIYNELSKLSETTYKPANYIFNKKPYIIVVSHHLKKDGAPMALLTFLHLIKEQYNIFIISPDDGPIRTDYINEGFCVFIGSVDKYNNNQFKAILNSASFYLCNTVVSHLFVILAYKLQVPTLWWIHEAEVYLTNCIPYLMPDYYSSPNIKIACSSKVVQPFIQELLNLPCYNLTVPVLDKFIDRDFFHTDNKPVVFFMPASLEESKGPDILAKAIVSLPEKYLKQSEFYFAGPIAKTQLQYHEIIMKISSVLNNVHYLGILSHEEVIEFNYSADCVIAPSRTDSLPATIIEGIMCGNIGIVSDHAGISTYMENAINGYIFHSENHNELKDIIIHIIDNIDELIETRINGRELYEKTFSPQSVLDKFHTIMTNI